MRNWIGHEGSIFCWQWDCLTSQQGRRRAIEFNRIGFEDIRVANVGEESGLENWDSFVCVGLEQLTRPIQLQPGQAWRAAQQLQNPNTWSIQSCCFSIDLSLWGHQKAIDHTSPLKKVCFIQCPVFTMCKKSLILLHLWLHIMCRYIWTS